MIKLADLLNEIEKPENIYVPGQSIEDSDLNFLKKGYRMTGTTIDPETGKSSSNVEQVADLQQISNTLGKILSSLRSLRDVVGEQPYVKTMRVQSTKLVKLLNDAQTLTNSLKGTLERIQKS